VTAIAMLTGPLPKAGVVVVALLVAVALLARGVERRAAAMLAALALAPTLLLVEIWNSPQLAVVHRHPLLAAAGALAGLAVVAVVAAVMSRRPALLGALVVVAIPFRIPIQSGGTTSNLLVPLYLVVAAGSLAFILPALLPRLRPTLRFGAPPADVPNTITARPPAETWLARLLALYIVLYGLQSVYSDDFEKALQQMVFFYVPFALMFVLLRQLAWTPAVVRRCLQLVAALAVLFAVVGFVEYATKTIILNPKLVVANDLHTYFTVNSVFFDPDIFGRFLALVMILMATVLLYGGRQRDQLGVTAVLAVLWAALVLTLSRSSLAALLVGLATLAALRWQLRGVLIAAAVVLAIGVGAVAVSPKTFGLNQGLNGASSGRAGLVSGGIALFGDRPVAGYGSGSFVTEYRAHHPRSSQTLSASHTIPITVAAEQGVIGELAYVALVVGAVAALMRGVGPDPARAAIAAAFLALLFHTLLYADFLEDPVTWTLLGVGTALAFRRAPSQEPAKPRAAEPAPIAA
jgi:O-antigen ligase